MFDKLKNFYAVFRAGQSVADAWKLKNWQLVGSYVGTLIGTVVAIGRLYGYNFYLTDEQLVTIGGFVTIVLSMLHGGAAVASTDKIGVLPFRRPDTTSESGMSSVDSSEPPESVRTESGVVIEEKSIWG